jgi:hypothetical protein
MTISSINLIVIRRINDVVLKEFRISSPFFEEKENLIHFILSCLFLLLQMTITRQVNIKVIYICFHDDFIQPLSVPYVTSYMSKLYLKWWQSFLLTSFFTWKSLLHYFTLDFAGYFTFYANSKYFILKIKVRQPLVTYWPFYYWLNFQ